MNDIAAAQGRTGSGPGIPACVHVITLAALDLRRLRDFYHSLGWSLAIDLDNFAAFETDGAILALFGQDALSRDSGQSPAAPQPGTPGFSLGIVVSEPDQVDQAIAAARNSGGRITKEPAAAEEFEGRHAYFADPEDNLWEVACLAPDSFFWRLRGGGGGRRN